MARYARSNKAATDILRVMQLKQLEIRQGYLKEDYAKELEACAARIRELTGEETVDLILTHGTLFAHALTKCK